MIKCYHEGSHIRCGRELGCGFSLLASGAPAASEASLSWLILQPQLKFRETRQSIHAAAWGCSALLLPSLPILGTDAVRLPLRQARSCESLHCALQLAEKQEQLSLKRVRSCTLAHPNDVTIRLDKAMRGL